MERPAGNSPHDMSTDEAQHPLITQSSQEEAVAGPVNAEENSNNTRAKATTSRLRLKRQRGIQTIKEKAKQVWRTIRGTVTFDPAKAPRKKKHSMYSSDSSASPDNSCLADKIVRPKMPPNKNNYFARRKEEVNFNISLHERNSGGQLH